MMVQREFGYTVADFNRVRIIIRHMAGIHLADSKDSLVYSRLVPRLRRLGFDSITAYLDYLEVNEEEAENFINSLTTNLTSFFREPHHFEILTDFIKKGEKVKHVWCAASSTGEEPYSIAMTLVRAYGAFDIPVKITASDIDSNVLATASEGIYPIKQVMPLADKKTFFYRGKGEKQELARVVPPLRNLIAFQRINLMDNDWPIKDMQDVIFCRNVMIYFDKETQLKILKRLISKLRPGGLYIAGHSENFSGMSEYIKPIGRTAYIRL